MTTSSILPESLSPVTTELHSNWEFAQRFTAAQDIYTHTGGEKTWLPATVPGHVHLDLQKAGVIGDPFFRQQEMGVEWVDKANWTYRTTFALSAERLAVRGESGRHFLEFGGLDTIARVFLNDTLIANVENGYIPYRFDVTDTVREGDNMLRIEFDSALRIGQERALAYVGDGTSERGKQSYFNFSARAFVRKPQYEFGWDWGPELISCGIAGPVQLVTVPHAEIIDWHLRYHFTSPVSVDMSIEITVAKYSSAPLTVGVAMYAPGDNTPESGLPDAPGTYTVTLPIYNQPVAPWNPNGQDVLSTISNLRIRPKGGLQQRYLINLRVWLSNDDEEADKEFVFHKGITVGFKKLELITEMDADGKGSSFLFRVNGIDTFIKGANWIPDHSFPISITAKQLRQKLTMARDAGFNMIRVWGGGLYESEDFYNLCDELGLLVWQDFPFACSMYPDDLPEFREAVQAEALAAIKRIRHRASLALWCGGNENRELFQHKWDGPTQATKFFGETTTDELLPAILAEADPDTPYWPNSPYSGTPELDTRDENYGDAHYWAVWHSHGGSTGDWIHYAESDCRFSSEFGFCAPCGYAAWESCTLPEDRTPRSLVAQWHDKTRKGYETYLGYIEKHFPKIETWDDLIYYGQANQAMALSFGIEHWRRRKGRCWGTLFWQLNDCWPTQSWAVIDSAGEGRIAYFAAKRTFYAPILVSLVEQHGTVEAHVINDTLTGISGRLTLSLEHFDGGLPAWSETIDVSVAANATNSDAVPLLTAPLPDAAQQNRNQFFFRAVLVAPDGVTVIGENILLLDEPKNLQLSDPQVTWSISREDVKKGVATLTVSAEKFAGFVYFYFEGLTPVVPQLSDNGFHQLPGVTKTITISGLPAEITAEELTEKLRVRHL